MITRQEGYSRTLYADNRPIGRICLHDGVKILKTIQQGWIEHYDNIQHNPSDVVKIDITYRVANKINLAKKDNFIVKYADKDKSYYETGYALYLYVSDYAIQSPKTYIFENGLESKTTVFAKVSVPCVIKAYTYCVQSKTYTYVEVPKTKLTIQHSVEYGKTEYGQQIVSLTDNINEIAGSDLLDHQITKILKHFDIIRKN